MDNHLELEPVQACPVCESTTFVPAVSVVHLNTRIFFSLCQNCGAVFLNPRMTDAATTIYYQAYYREITAPNEAAQERDRKVQQTRAKIQRLFLDNEFTRLHLPPIISHLEIGSSAGYLLEAIGAAYTYGLEPNDLYQDQEPAKTYQRFSYYDLIPAMPMDLVSLSHSLEHLNHPLHMLRGLVEKHSKPKFLIEVPDCEYNSHDALLLHHPVAYDANVLRKLFQAIGYEPLAIANHGLGSPFKLYLLALFAPVEEK